MIREISNIGVSFHEAGFINFDEGYLSKLFDRYYQGNLCDRYDNVAEFKSSDISSYPELSEVAQRIDQKLGISNEGYCLDKLWLVKTEPENADTSKLPYVPHIDYHRFLKVMIYIDDVGSLDGPFTARSDVPEKYETKRLALSNNHKDRRENLITDFPETEYFRYMGQSGSILIFDTNCPHYAGEVKAGGGRRVIRLDFYKPEWRRKRPLFARIKAFLKDK